MERNIKKQMYGLADITQIHFSVGPYQRAYTPARALVFCIEPSLLGTYHAQNAPESARAAPRATRAYAPTHVLHVAHVAHAAQAVHAVT